MAVGDPSGAPRPRRIVTAGRCCSRPEVRSRARRGARSPGQEADPEWSACWREEEEIERLTATTTRTPHFRGDD